MSLLQKFEICMLHFGRNGSVGSTSSPLSSVHIPRQTPPVTRLPQRNHDVCPQSNNIIFFRHSRHFSLLLRKHHNEGTMYICLCVGLGAHAYLHMHECVCMRVRAHVRVLACFFVIILGKMRTC